MPSEIINKSNLKTMITDIVINELNKRDKILNKTQLNNLIKQGVIEHTKCLFNQQDKQRRRINEIENKLK